MDATETVVDALAVARIVRFVQIDTITERPRLAVQRALGDRTIVDLLVCEWCLAPWVAAGVSVARHRWPRSWGVVARVLATSMAASAVVQRTS